MGQYAGCIRHPHDFWRKIAYLMEDLDLAEPDSLTQAYQDDFTTFFITSQLEGKLANKFPTFNATFDMVQLFKRCAS